MYTLSVNILIQRIQNTIRKSIEDRENNLKEACISSLFLYISIVIMSKSKKTYDKELDFNGGWTIGEANIILVKKPLLKHIRVKNNIHAKKNIRKI